MELTMGAKSKDKVLEIMQTGTLRSIEMLAKDEQQQVIQLVSSGFDAQQACKFCRIMAISLAFLLFLRVVHGVSFVVMTRSDGHSYLHTCTLNDLHMQGPALNQQRVF